MSGRPTAVLLGALSLLLAGCASAPPATQPLVSLEAAANFDVTGRVAVKYDDQGFSGGFHWTHDGHSDDIYLMTPLGQAVARIFRDASGVTLTTQEGKQLKARDPESLTREALGWSLPVEGLQFWILGRPAPGPKPVAIRDAENRLARLEQDTWGIEYLGYRAAESGALPGKMRLTRGDLEIRLVIDRWRLADVGGARN